MKAPLPRPASRAFVLALLLVMAGLAVYAAVSIRRGWADPVLQERVRTLEAEREAAEP